MTEYKDKYPKEYAEGVKIGEEQYEKGYNFEQSYHFVQKTSKYQREQHHSYIEGYFDGFTLAQNEDYRTKQQEWEKELQEDEI